MLETLWLMCLVMIVAILVAEIRVRSRETVVHVCDNMVLTNKGHILYVTEQLQIGDRIVVENKHTFVRKVKGERR